MVWRYLEMFFAKERLGEHVHHWQNRHHLAATGFCKVRGRCWAAQVVLEPVSDVLSVSSHLQSGDRAIEPGIGKWWIIMKWAFCHMVKNVLRMFIANLINADNHEKRLDTYNTTDDLRHRCINIKTTHTHKECSLLNVISTERFGWTTRNMKPCYQVNPKRYYCAFGLRNFDKHLGVSENCGKMA